MRCFAVSLAANAELATLADGVYRNLGELPFNTLK
jgi:hypothetical protein